MGVCSPDPQADRGYSFSLSSPPTPAALRRQASWILHAEYGSLAGSGDSGWNPPRCSGLGNRPPACGFPGQSLHVWEPGDLGSQLLPLLTSISLAQFSSVHHCVGQSSRSTINSLNPLEIAYGRVLVSTLRMGKLRPRGHNNLFRAHNKQEKSEFNSKM